MVDIEIRLQIEGDEHEALKCVENALDCGVVDDAIVGVSDIEIKSSSVGYATRVDMAAVQSLADAAADACTVMDGCVVKQNMASPRLAIRALRAAVVKVRETCDVTMPATPPPAGLIGEIDPDANLREQLALAKSIIDDEFEVDSGDAEALAQRVVELAAWLSRGGVLPRDWQR